MAATISRVSVAPISATSVVVSDFFSPFVWPAISLIFTALWDRMSSKCTRKPSCDLWDENMLLEERERARAVVRERQQQLHHPVPVQALEPPPPPPYRPRAASIPDDPEQSNDLEWLRNPSTRLDLFGLPSDLTKSVQDTWEVVTSSHHA